MKARVGTVVLACMCLLGCSPNTGETSKSSEQAQGFVQSVRDDSSGFYFTVEYHHGEPGLHPFSGIQFLIERPSGTQVDAVLIRHPEAVRIVEHFAATGQLDRQDVMPPGEPFAGWNVFLGTAKVRAYWHLGSETASLLKHSDILEVRAVLSDEAKKPWDKFLAQVRENTTPKGTL